MSTTTASPLTQQPELNDGKLTIWQPLTSAWPSSAGCESSFWQVDAPYIAAWDPGYGIWVQPGFLCQPPQVTSWWDADNLGLVDLSKTQISIGPIVCPEAYTTVSSSVNAGGSTFVACCPSNYRFAGEYPGGVIGECLSRVEDGQEIRFATKMNDTYITTSTTASGVVQVVGVPVNGWLFPNSASAHTSTSPSPSPSSSSAQPENTSESYTNSTASTSSGLSTGSKAGIGVGVSLGVIAIGSAIAALLIRRRRVSAAPGKPAIPAMQGSSHATELP